MELDKLIPCKDGKFIGVLCKRTFRERWKQAFTSDLALLEEHNIKSLWHAITYDRDLSDKKITEIGTHRGIIYLPDGSACFLAAQGNEEMKNFVRPLTHLIRDLKNEIG